ncbi:ABC transporter ATP-binding protein [Mycoplasmatota bacterium WC44]
MKKLMRIAKNQWLMFLIGLLFTILLGVTRSYIPLFVEYIVDSLLGSTDPKLPAWIVDLMYAESFKTHLLRAAIGLSVFALFRGVLMIFNSISKAKFSESIAREQRDKVYSHIQNLPYTYHNDADTGDLIQRCTTDIDTIRMFFQNHVFNIFWIGALAVSVINQMIKIDTTLTVVSLIVLPITVGISVYYFKRIQNVFTEVEESEAKLTTTVQENLNGVRVVKAFSNEQYEIEKFNEKNEAYRKQSLRMYGKMANYWSTSDFITMTQYSLTLVIGTYYAMRGYISIGELVAFIMLVQVIVWPIRNLGRIVAEYGKTTVSMKRLEDIFKVEDEYVDNGTKVSDINGEIEFENVSFKFDDTDQNLLDNVSLKIKAGETIALIGKTGAGKSTIVKLLIRLLDYKKGKILIDGTEITEYDKKHLRSNVGVILQEPFLFSKTVQENIGITLRNKDIKKVHKAAQLASVHNDINAFEQGYDTLVGEKGVTLSGGQKQRVAIARLLIEDRPIMVFDDSKIDLLWCLMTL